MPKKINVCSDLVINFSQEKNNQINSIIQKFVNEMSNKKQSVSYYVEKRNATVNKAMDDIFLGKKAECVARTALIKYFDFPMIDMDFEIRMGGKKGWDKDLQFSKVSQEFPDVHVKACSKSTFDFCDDYTWTFQKSNNDNKFGQDDVLTEKNNDLIAFVYLENARSNKGVVKAILPQAEIFPYLKLPKKVSLWGIKRCVYYQDIKENSGLMTGV